jgi:hypothetical protein
MGSYGINVMIEDFDGEVYLPPAIPIDELIQEGKLKDETKEGLIYTLCMLCKIYSPGFIPEEDWSNEIIISLMNEITSRVYDDDNENIISEFELEEILENKLQDIL